MVVLFCCRHTDDAKKGGGESVKTMTKTPLSLACEQLAASGNPTHMRTIYLSADRSGAPAQHDPQQASHLQKLPTTRNCDAVRAKSVDRKPYALLLFTIESHEYFVVASFPLLQHQQTYQ